MNPDRFDSIMAESIEAEIESRDFYKAAAQRVADPGVKAIFEGLARDEEEHRNLLETFRFNPEAKVAFERVQDFGVSEELDFPKLSLKMTPKEAFQLAIKKEQMAMQTYQALADTVSDAEVKRVLTELAEMERGHKAALEKLFVDIAYPEAW